ncbi:MAG: hypothetical protein KC431_03725, partial [Myxococcales bacterium]|nr:hypothetical protein [Myxococcales bacterium]
MRVPRRPLLLTLALLVAAPACTHGRDGKTEVPAIVAPAEISDLDDYAVASNAYALLALDDPARAPLRGRLRDYLTGYLEQAIREGRHDAAAEALEQLAGLWTPSELRSAGPDPAVSKAADALYQVASRTGDERPALLALGMLQVFAEPAGREQAATDYGLLVDWIERNRDFGNEPNFRDTLERLLEDVSSVFPSPFLIDALTDSYLARHRAAQQQQGGPVDPRTTFTGYLVARAHLRADNPKAAIDALDRMQVDESTQALRDLIVDATGPEPRSAADLNQLISEFIPTPDTRLPPAIVRQSWGIVDNLAQRALAKFPDDPPAQLARGRVMRSRGLHEAAIVFYERAFAAKNRASDRADLYLAWCELAELYQAVLEDRLSADPDGAEALLARVEA